MSEPREVPLDQIIGSVAGYSNLHADWTPKTWTPTFQKVYDSMRTKGYKPEQNDDRYGSIRVFEIDEHYWVDQGFHRVAAAKMLKLETVRARVWETLPQGE